jgi:formylglycine-generating enzyme required for sulfatase activity
MTARHRRRWLIGLPTGIAVLLLFGMGLRIFMDRDPLDRVQPETANAPNVESSVEKQRPAAPPPAVAPFDADRARKHQEEWADYLGVPAETTNSIGMKLILIPPGEFDMGSTASEVDRLHEESLQHGYDGVYTPGLRAEMPKHRVRITQPFRLCAHEVTIGQFRRFVQATGTVTEADKKGGGGVDSTGLWRSRGREYSWRNRGFEQTDDHPVVNVTWNDARAFCEWLSWQESCTYELPTEAQWEHACRAGTVGHYGNGDVQGVLEGSANVADVSCENAMTLLSEDWVVAWNDGYPFTAPVGRFKPNAFGIHDVIGNAAEWCADWFKEDFYAESPRDDPTGPPSGTARVWRGGAWYDGKIRAVCSCTFRCGMRAAACNQNLGFRVAQTVSLPPGF